MNVYLLQYPPRAGTQVWLTTALGFAQLTPEVKARICNGAGAADDWRSKLIPNTLWGLDCTQVFDIHDHAYYVGRTAKDKRLADLNMLDNLLRIINAAGGWLRVVRRYRAMTYYQAVCDYGYDAFWTPKAVGGYSA